MICKCIIVFVCLKSVFGSLVALLCKVYVLKSNPELSILNVVKFLQYFFVSVASALDYSPEANELILGDLAVAIEVDLVKELLGRYFSVVALPVLDGFCLVDVLTAINVEYFERFYHL